MTLPTRTGLRRSTPILGLLFAGALGLSACGSGGSTTTTTAAAPSTADTEAAMMAAHHQAFCANATALGSLSKGSSSAMAMAPADSSKDFMALSDKVKALRADAPTAALQADIDTVVTRLGLEVMVESHKA